MELTGKRITLGVTGGIAAYKSAELVRLLIKQGATVRVAMSEAATRFALRSGDAPRGRDEIGELSRALAQLRQHIHAEGGRHDVP